MRPTRRDSALVAVGAVVSGAGGFLFTWLLARATGPAGTGAVLTVTTWFTLLLTVGKFGMDTTLVREGGRLRVSGPGLGGKELLRWTLLPVVGLAVVAGAVIALLAEPIGEWMVADSPVPVTPLVVLLGLMLPLGVYTVVRLAYLRGLGSMTAYVAIEQLLKPGLRMVGAGLLLLVGVTGALAYGWVWFVPVLLGAVATLVVARRVTDPAGGVGDVAAERARIWRYGAPRAASQIVDIANTSFGTVTLAALATAAEAGAFATALRIVFAGQLVFQAVRLLVAPSFAALLAERRHTDAQEVFSAGTALIVALAWPVFLVCLILPDAILGLFGAGFESAAPALQVLALSGLLLAVVGNQGSVVLMSGRSAAALVAISLGLAANVALTLTLLAWLGPVAAAVGWTASVAVEGAVLGWVLHREGFRPVPPAALTMAARICVPLVPALLLAAWAWPNAAIALPTALLGLIIAMAWAAPAARHEFRMLTRGEVHG